MRTALSWNSRRWSTGSSPSKIAVKPAKIVSNEGAH
jgi:hypothetical protein